LLEGVNNEEESDIDSTLLVLPYAPSFWSFPPKENDDEEEEEEKEKRTKFGTRSSINVFGTSSLMSPSDKDKVGGIDKGS